MSRAVGSFLIDHCQRLSANHQVRIAETHQDLQRIGRLRYSLFVAKDGKSYPCADHENQCFIEPIDHKSLNICGVNDSTCLTAIRLTRAQIALEDDYLQRLLNHSPFDASRYGRLTVVSRLVAARHKDAKPLMVGAMREGYRVALANGIAFAVAATRPSLVPFFSRMGFVASGVSYVEAIAGEMCVVVLDLHDRAHFTAVGSIFREVLDEFEPEERIGASA